MAKPVGRIVAVDIPKILLGQIKIDFIREVLAEEVKKFFDLDEIFKGIKINFEENISKFYEDKTERIAFSVSIETYNYLKAMKNHTLISMKKLAEIIIIQKLLGVQTVGA